MSMDCMSASVSAASLSSFIDELAENEKTRAITRTKHAADSKALIGSVRAMLP